MRCDNADELILMLKASDRVLNDVLHAFETCVDYDPSIAATHKYVLSLRKWYDFNRSRELRCFVVNSKLTGNDKASSFFSVHALSLPSGKARKLTLLLFVCFLITVWIEQTGVSQRYLNEDTSDLNEEKTDILDKVKDFFDQVMKEKVALKSCKYRLSWPAGSISLVVCVCVCVNLLSISK